MAITHKPASGNPLPAGLAPLTGLRPIANLWILALHCWWTWRALLPGGYEQSRELAASNSVLWAIGQGGTGADVFLVLSACLATYHLLPALEGAGSSKASSPASLRAVVLSYLRKRALRILPAYLLFNALSWLLVLPAGRIPPLASLSLQLVYYNCPAGLKANLLLATNMIPTLEMCGGHLWSAVISIHLYLALPLLLCALRPRVPGFRARLAATLAALFAAGTAWRCFRAFQAGFHLPIGDFVTHPAEAANLMQYLDGVYASTPCRVAQLATGVALGVLLRSPAAISWLKSRPFLVSGAAFALQAGWLRSAATATNLHPAPGARPLGPTASALAGALATCGSPLYSLAIVATIVALLLQSDLVHGLLARVLASPAWEAPARLSFGVYLLHELVKYGIALAAPDLITAVVAQAPLAALAAFMAAVVACSYVAAWLQWRLVERQFHKLA